MTWLLRAIAVCVWLAPGVQPSHAYPEKPIRLIVTFPPGGSTDIVARAIQPHLEKQLKQSVIIDNRPGAGGVIGLDAVAKAPPDGYTVGVAAAGALVINVSLQEKMPYDPLKDLAPVTKLAESPFILAATPSFQASAVRDVVALAQRSPGTISLGYGGNGTAMHLTAQMFNGMAGVTTALVPYRGTAAVVTDLIGGHVQLGIVDPPPSLAAFRAGQIKPIAISSPQRFSMLPDIPTFAEQGLAGFESTGWFGIVVPAGTPANIIVKLNEAFVAGLKDADVAERIRSVGMERAPMSPGEFAAYIKGEIDKWSRVVAASRAKSN
jgi:tripartite-type tricarboxylate transporter receptor subunit TctC